MRLESAFKEAKVNFEKQVPLARYTTFRIGGPADYLLCPESPEALAKAVSLLEEEGVSYFPLGGGSNLLVRDGGFRGAVLSLSGLKKFFCEGDLVRAEAGVFLPSLLSFCVEKGLSGLEFLAGVPATVGGAVVMNAGAFGQEIKDVLEGILICRGEELEFLERKRLSISYRALSLPPASVVVSATFRLNPSSPSEVKARISSFLAQRREKQPLSYPSAGSIFKNPPEAAAGYLIEAAGLKGMRRGGAEISRKHANFIVNTGKARAEDVLYLMEFAKERVFREFGIILEEEVRIVGEG